MGRHERAAKREATNAPSELLTPEPSEAPRTLAVALVPDGGGYRIARFSLDVDTIEMLMPELSEPEVFGVQISKAATLLEEYARGEGDAPEARATCPQCGANSLRRHPSKPVSLCSNGNCNARIDAA